MDNDDNKDDKSSHIFSTVLHFILTYKIKGKSDYIHLPASPNA